MARATRLDTRTVNYLELIGNGRVYEVPPYQRAAGRRDSVVNRIGNLTLLEAGLNREVGNASYAGKIGAYRKSRYALARAIPETAPEEWTLPILESRHRRLAEGAVHLWRSDFA